jgi:hypothetical protein
MGLDRAMRLVARGLPPGLAAPELTERVRSALLGLLDGRPPEGLPLEEADSLQAWLRNEYGGHSDPAGALYQAILGRAVEALSDGAVAVRANQRGHRATGAYYTLDAVVTYMVGRAKTYLPGATSLIDPACGSGAFLAGARRGFEGRLTRLTGLDADAQALALCRRNVPEADLHRADALLDQAEGGYDLCLGNPPYVSSGLRGAAQHDRQRHVELKQRYSATAQYKLNTYPLFVERGLELLRGGGVLGFVVPDSFLSGRFFTGMRHLLLRHTLLELTLIREDFWEHGRVGQSVILFVRKEMAPDDHRIAVRVVPRVADLAQAPTAAMTLGELTWGPLQRFRLIADAAEQTFVRDLEAGAGSLTLGDWVHTYSGLIARNGQRSILRSASPHLQGPWGPLLRSGREIDRYKLQWAGDEVCLDPEMIKSGGHLAYYQGPKLLLRQTADCLRAVFDDRGYYCLNNIHLLVPRLHGMDLRTLLALMNSEPINRYYRAVTMEAGRLYAQVDLDLLAGLPLPPLSPETAEQLADLARARESAAPDEAALLERRIDEVVWRCYAPA